MGHELQIVTNDAARSAELRVAELLVRATSLCSETASKNS
jgi:hypothetical protein